MKFTYNGKTVEVLPPVKRYVNAIERKLRLPWKVRARVMSDVSTGICARHEAGESYEEIMQSMGAPAEVAEGLNREMADYVYHKSPWRFAFLALAVLAGLWLGGYALSGWALSARGGAPAGIIGGADGLTAIFVVGELPAGWQAGLAAGLLAAGLAGWFMLKRCKPKKK